MAGRYRIYGDLESRETMTLTTIFVAKGLAADLVEETPSLRMALASRSGHEFGPYLRTPDGFVLGELRSIVNWIETAHPEPPLLPSTPLRRTCARLIEDWIEYWLPLWPRRSWSTMQRLGEHLAASGTLLGGAATRSDWMLAAWLEADVINKPELRAHIREIAPSLLRYGNALFDASHSSVEDDAIPISLLSLLEDLGSDYHDFLAANQTALKDREDRVLLDLGLGERAFPVRSECERQRIQVAEDLRAMTREERQTVRQVLEPVGAWHALTLPPVVETIDPSDPRSL